MLHIGPQSIHVVEVYLVIEAAELAVDISEL